MLEVRQREEDVAYSLSPTIRAQPPHDFLGDAAPVDASRLPVPLHHQAVQRCYENTCLRLHLDIRAKLSNSNARLQQLAECGDTAPLPLSRSLRQRGNVLTQIPALYQHAAGIDLRFHLLPVDLNKDAQGLCRSEIGCKPRLDRCFHSAIPTFRNRQVERLFTG